MWPDCGELTEGRADSCICASRHARRTPRPIAGSPSALKSECGQAGAGYLVFGGDFCGLCAAAPSERRKVVIQILHASCAAWEALWGSE